MHQEIISLTTNDHLEFLYKLKLSALHRRM
jgi:hypothetical protein